MKIFFTFVSIFVVGVLFYGVCETSCQRSKINRRKIIESHVEDAKKTINSEFYIFADEKLVKAYNEIKDFNGPCDYSLNDIQKMRDSIATGVKTQRDDIWRKENEIKAKAEEARIAVEQAKIDAKHIKDAKNQVSTADGAAPALNGSSLLCISILFLGFYFLPTLIAISKSHNNTVAIFALNLLGLSWPICLIWALSNPPTQKVIIVRE